MIGVSDLQMESLVSAEFAEVNEGFSNSEIGIDITIVHQTIVSPRLLLHQQRLGLACPLSVDGRSYWQLVIRTYI